MTLLTSYQKQQKILVYGLCLHFLILLHINKIYANKKMIIKLFSFWKYGLNIAQKHWLVFPWETSFQYPVLKWLTPWLAISNCKFLFTIRYCEILQYRLSFFSFQMKLLKVKFTEGENKQKDFVAHQNLPRRFQGPSIYCRIKIKNSAAPYTYLMYASVAGKVSRISGIWSVSTIVYRNTWLGN